jgi:hypothetical protein
MKRVFPCNIKDDKVTEESVILSSLACSCQLSYNILHAQQDAKGSLS